MTIWLHLIQETEKSGFGCIIINSFTQFSVTRVQNQTEKPSQIMYHTKIW